MPAPEEEQKRTDRKQTRRFNLFDCFVALVVVTLAFLIYYKLSAPNRVAPPYALEENRVAVEVALQLPADQAWMCAFATPGLAEIDPRTGEPRAEVLDCTVVEGHPVVRLTVHAVRDGSGRLLFEGEPLVPGRVLQLETGGAILEGVVRRVDGPRP